LLASLHIAAYGRFRHYVGALLPDPLPDAMRGVPVFAGSQLVCAQNLVNELHYRAQPGLIPHRRFALGRNRTG